ncbi:ATP-binding protein [Saccharopolyspora terrae]|uniref:ATP-binding protein n=1 Tax=Saccharopolyspora terrae TaxID=2530384 RepID=UPI001404D919|nr:tetratricopeptide repeat protein [Saccharopolyspora terrae]
MSNEPQGFSGTAKNVVQATSISGGVHFHHNGFDAPVPHQLPTSIKHFTNRETILAGLNSLLDEPADGSTPTSLVVGSGGVGKTSLATYWAHRVRERFPDGDLYVDLHGYHDTRRVPPDDSLESILCALGVPGDRVPTDTDAKAAMYRSLLHGRRMLILLDNAATAEQVRPLLPDSPTCLVLVTSRNRLPSLLTREGAIQMALDVLPPEHAAELLRSTVGADRIDAEPEAASELARRCGYLPLALRIAGERLVSSPHLRISELVAEVAEERLDAFSTEDEFGSIRAVFASSYRALPPEAATLFRLLSLPESPDISVPAAAALAGLTSTRTRRLLETLVGAHLLDEHQPRRFRFHDLISTFAAECAEADATADERDAAVRRLLSWYLHAMISASWKVAPEFTRIELDHPEPIGDVPEFTDRATALHWYDDERQNLLAAIRLASARDERVFAVQLPVELFAFLLTRRRVTDWLETHRIGLTAARARGDHLAEAWLLTSVAIAHRTCGDYESSLSDLERAVQLWQRFGPEWAQAWALRDLGAVYHQLGRHTEADEALETAQAMHVALGDEWGEATALSALALTECHIDQFDEALMHLERAIEIRRSQGDRRNEGTCLSHIGMVLGEMGRTDEAVERIEQALEIHHEVEFAYGAALSHERLADLFDRNGQADRAREHRRIAAELYDDLGVPHSLSA